MKEQFILILLIFSISLKVTKCPPKQNHKVLYNNYVGSEDKRKENKSIIKRSHSFNIKRSTAEENNEESMNEEERNANDVKYTVEEFLPTKIKYFQEFIAGLLSPLINMHKFEIKDRVVSIINNGDIENQCSVNNLYLLYKTGLKKETYEEYQIINPYTRENQDPILFMSNCLVSKKTSIEELKDIKLKEENAKIQIETQKASIEVKNQMIMEKYEILKNFIEKKGERQLKTEKKKVTAPLKIKNLLTIKKHKEIPHKKKAPEDGANASEEDNKITEMLKIKNDINIIKQEVKEITIQYNKFEEYLSPEKSEKREMHKKKLKKLSEINCPLYCANPLKGLTINGLIDRIGNLINFFKALIHCLDKVKEFENQLNIIHLNKSESVFEKISKFLEEETIEKIIIKATQNSIKALSHPFAIAGSIIKIIANKVAKNEQKKNYFKGRLMGFLLLYILKAKDFDS